MSESARRMLCTWWRLVASGANRQQLAHQYAGVLIRQSSCDVTVATSISGVHATDYQRSWRGEV